MTTQSIRAEAATPPGTITLRVLTWNIWGTEGPEERQDALRDTITALDPDLVSLQEVARSDGRDQLSHVLGATGLTGVHQLDVMAAPSVGTALASRWPPKSVVGSILPSPPGSMVCNLLAATIPLPIGADLLFLAVKPYWAQDGEAYRARSAVAMADVAEALGGPAPTIIAGDFDGTPDSDALRFLAGGHAIDGRSVHYLNAWDVAGDGGPGHTWTTNCRWVADCVEDGWIQPGHARRIDHILVRGPDAYLTPGRERAPKVRATVQECRVVGVDPPVSDHYGVLATIELTVLGA